MDREIIDQPIWDQAEVVKWLQESGYTNAYPIKNGRIMVQQNAQVRVRISTHKSLRIRPTFPEIGNSVQIISTIFFAVLLFFLNISFGLFWAIGLGQLISLAFYYPSALRLKAELERLLHDRYAGQSSKP